MLREATVVRLVGALYDTAQGLGDWPAFLDQLRTATGSVSVALVAATTAAADGAVMAGIAPEWERAYREYYSARHPLKVFPARLREGFFSYARPLSTDFEYRNTEFFCDFWRPQQFADDVWGIYRREGDRICTLSMIRPERHPSFSRDDVRLFRAVMAHMRRATDLEVRLAQLAWRGDALSEVFDGLPQAVVVVDRERTVHGANRAARRLLAGGAGLAVVRGALRAARPAIDRQIDALVGQAIQTRAGGTALRAGHTLVIEREPPRMPIEILVTPFRADGSPPAARRIGRVRWPAHGGKGRAAAPLPNKLTICGCASGLIGAARSSACSAARRDCPWPQRTPVERVIDSGMWRCLTKSWPRRPCCSMTRGPRTSIPEHTRAS